MGHWYYEYYGYWITCIQIAIYQGKEREKKICAAFGKWRQWNWNEFDSNDKNHFSQRQFPKIVQDQGVNDRALNRKRKNFTIKNLLPQLVVIVNHFEYISVIRFWAALMFDVVICGNICVCVCRQLKCFTFHSKEFWFDRLLEDSSSVW